MRSRPQKVCVTGGAGFIGSNLADELHRSGLDVVVLDDFRAGRREFLEGLLGQSGFTLVEADVLDPDALRSAVSGCDWVFHLQANADVRQGLDHPTRDLEQNTVATSRVLEAMRRTGVHRIVFSSTGSVYGEPSIFPTPEDAPFPTQTSLYGASKLAGEGLVAAYAAGFEFTGIICRFVSILGERYTHGHVYDFYRSLRRDPLHLRVLGDGRQEKSYLYVKDCVSAMLRIAEVHQSTAGVHIYNLGTDETVMVDESVAIICDYLGLSPHVEHVGGPRGWIGDSPLINLDTRKIRSLGWEPTLSFGNAVRRTIDWLMGSDYLWRAEPGSSLPGQ
jgi:UDP-glucose 4-epimerase